MISINVNDLRSHLIISSIHVHYTVTVTQPTVLILMEHIGVMIGLMPNLWMILLRRQNLISRREPSKSLAAWCQGLYNVLLFNVFVAQSMLMCEDLSVQDWFNLSFTDQVFPVFQIERVMWKNNSLRSSLYTLIWPYLYPCNRESPAYSLKLLEQMQSYPTFWHESTINIWSTFSS